MNKIIEYSIRINDFHTDPQTCRQIVIPANYGTIDEAEEAGWHIIVALAFLYGLDYENQGDQYMAFYNGGERDGLGAFTVEILDEAGEPIEEL